MRYMVVIEKGEINYGVHVPDLPGLLSENQKKKSLHLSRWHLNPIFKRYAHQVHQYPNLPQSVNSLTLMPHNKPSQPRPKNSATDG